MKFMIRFQRGKKNKLLWSACFGIFFFICGLTAIQFQASAQQTPPPTFGQNSFSGAPSSQSGNTASGDASGNVQQLNSQLKGVNNQIDDLLNAIKGTDTKNDSSGKQNAKQSSDSGCVIYKDGETGDLVFGGDFGNSEKKRECLLAKEDIDDDKTQKKLDKVAGKTNADSSLSDDELEKLKKDIAALKTGQSGGGSSGGSSGGQSAMEEALAELLKKKDKQTTGETLKDDIADLKTGSETETLPQGDIEGGQSSPQALRDGASFSQPRGNAQYDSGQTFGNAPNINVADWNKIKEHCVSGGNCCASDIALAQILKWEGCPHKPKDLGDGAGYTTCGVTQKYHGNIVFNLTETDLRRIYDGEYRMAAGCQNLNNAGALMQCWNIAVHAGPGRSKQLNAGNNQQQWSLNYCGYLDSMSGKSGGKFAKGWNRRCTEATKFAEELTTMQEQGQVRMCYQGQQIDRSPTGNIGLPR